MFRLFQSRLTCPICGNASKKFKEYVGTYYLRGELVDHFTPNALCPKCNSDMRHRLIFTFMKNHTNLLKEKITLLHFAPEEYLYDFICEQKNINYIPCDIKHFDYKNFKQLDMTNIELPDEAVDAIINIHVLEHIEEDIKAIAELYRVVRKGGWVLIAVPTYGVTTYEDMSLDAEGRAKIYGLDQHVRMNGLDLKNKLEAAGFSVDIHSFDTVPGPYVDRSVSSPHVDSDKYLFYCMK